MSWKWVRVIVGGGLLSLAPAVAQTDSHKLENQMPVNTYAVAAYGAVPNDMTDDGPAVRAALFAAMDSGQPALIDFQPGRYLISPAPTHWQFNNDHDSLGWNVESGSLNIQRGWLEVHAGDQGPCHLVSPGHLGLDGSRFSFLRLTISPDNQLTELHLAWTTQRQSQWYSARSIRIPVSPAQIASGQIVIDLRNTAGWRGELIRCFRLELPAATPLRLQNIMLRASDDERLTRRDIIGRNAFDFHGFRGLTLRGSQTELLMTDPFAGVFRFREAQSLVFTGLRIDYQQAPCPQGIITAVDPAAGTFDFKPDGNDGAVLDDPRAALLMDGQLGCWGTVRDRNQPHRIKSTAPNFIVVVSVTRLPDGITYRLTVPDSLRRALGAPGRIEPGDPFVLGFRGTQVAGFDIIGGSDITIDNCIVHRGAGATVLGQGMKGQLLMNGLQVIRRSDQQMVTAAGDGVHIQGSERGPIIVNSTFEGLLDDCVNFYQRPGFVAQVLSPDRLVVVGFNLPQVGHQIALFNSGPGSIRATPRVVQRQALPDRLGAHAVELTLDQPIEGVVAGNNLAAADAVFNLTHNFQGYRIEGCTFRDGRRKGLLLRPGDGVVRNNHFVGLGGPAVAVRNEIGTYDEGLFADNLIIENNTIRDCLFVSEFLAAAHTGVIEIVAYARGHKPATDRLQRNITLRSNTIDGYQGAAISITSAQSIQVINNQLSAQFFEPVQLQPATVAPIRLQNVADVLIQNTLLRDPRTALKAAIHVQPDCTDVRLLDNTFHLAPGVTEIMAPNLTPQP